MHTLVRYYNQSLILYPRVENGYIKNSLFSYFPHPPLNVVNSFFEPLLKEEYETDSNTLLLHLHNQRFFNISQTVKTQELIKNNFNNKEKEKTNKAVIDNYLSFLEHKNQVEMDYFLKQQLNHYDIEKPKLKKINYEDKELISQIENINDTLCNTTIHTEESIHTEEISTETLIRV